MALGGRQIGTIESLPLHYVLASLPNQISLCQSLGESRKLGLPSIAKKQQREWLKRDNTRQEFRELGSVVEPERD